MRQPSFQACTQAPYQAQPRSLANVPAWDLVSSESGNNLWPRYPSWPRTSSPIGSASMSLDNALPPSSPSPERYSAARCHSAYGSRKRWGALLAICLWYLHFGEKGPGYFQEMTSLPLSNSVLLGGIGTRRLWLNSLFLQIQRKIPRNILPPLSDLKTLMLASNWVLIILWNNFITEDTSSFEIERWNICSKDKSSF